MNDHDFQMEVIDRLARIETKQDTNMTTLDEHGARIKSLEHTRTKYTAIFGSVGAAFGTLIGWIKS